MARHLSDEAYPVLDERACVREVEREKRRIRKLMKMHGLSEEEAIEQHLAEQGKTKRWLDDPWGHGW